MPKKLFIVACAAFIVSGCNSPKVDPYVGSWEGTAPNGVPVTITLGKDKTMVYSMANPQDAESKLNLVGIWHAENNKIYWKYKDISFEGLPLRFKPQEAKMKADIAKQVNVGIDTEVPVKWNDENSFTTTGPKGETTTFVRKKSDK